MKANPTDARDIALFFLSMTKGDVELPRVDFQRATETAKRLLLKYRKQDILDVIDLLVKERPDVYSLSYVPYVYDEYFRKVEAERYKRLAEIAKEKMSQLAREQQTEVKEDDGTSERNRGKADRFGTQSRLGEKYSFDMFERQGQDNGGGER